MSSSKAPAKSAKTAAPSLFERAPEPGLEVVHARAEHAATSTAAQLFSGYDRVRVLTYSNSISMIARLAAWCPDVEIIFGREDIINDATKLLHFQTLLLSEIREELTGAPRQPDGPAPDLHARIAAGTLRFFVVQQLVSHEKLFLLENTTTGDTRVLAGSANLSERGFGGVQNESFYVFDNDPVAWEAKQAKYLAIREQSAAPVAEEAFTDERLDTSHLPLFNPARATSSNGLPTIYVIEQGPPGPVVIEKFLAQRPPKVLTELAAQLVTSKNAVRVDRKIATEGIRYVKSNQRTAEANDEETVTVDWRTARVTRGGQPWPLEVADADVAADAALLVEYFAGYQQFHGNTAKLARDYFTFQCWLYLSPFLCDLRNDAARNGFIYDYPIFGILYGRSNCGKSELIRLLLKSMFGLDGFLEKDWFTKSKVAGLREQNQRYPLAFDDLDATRFNSHAVALIKEDHLVGQYPAVVLSMNQEKDSFETEIRKRCLVLYTDASLPDHTGVSRTLARQVKRLKSQLGTAFYRRYLLRVCEKLQTEGFPLDILTFSSEILVALFRESLPPQMELPAWCTVVSLDGYTRGKHDKVRTELLEILQHNPTAWQISGTRAVLIMEPMTLRKLRKDIPDYLLSSSRQGDRLVFKKDELEAFLEVQMGKKPSWWRRVLGEQ
ncbi:hypothetical protein Q5H92_19195 [Hymenobacter sp. M29]|uniref:PLD phosphodiesterase domain-containing protein n=1 Tax=Hymenobacter mellowenesis TaxID=3063995 RepID=A0ABT9AF77_9BACT|nr:hypothetical protein [Hymenobacter sp. M29]MDO7848501.1 hypothetical protein [Hymenobacter sp. M29]